MNKNTEPGRETTIKGILTAITKDHNESFFIGKNQVSKMLLYYI